jgi:hypothetical protein
MYAFNHFSNERPTRADMQKEIDGSFDMKYGNTVVDAICDFKEEADRSYNIRFYNHDRGMGPYDLHTIIKYYSNHYQVLPRKR